MPPKRAAGVATGATPTKRSRKSGGSDSADFVSAGESSSGAPRRNPEDTIRALLIQKLSNRWSAVSGSKNLESDYKLHTKESDKPYEFVCMCKSPFLVLDDDEDEDDDDDDNNDDEEQNQAPPTSNVNPALQQVPVLKKQKACDGGETCLCSKLASENPNHPWVIMRAGISKLNMQFTHTDLRCPDTFGMYTFNDHEGYGWVQTWQNLIIDYELAGLEKNWREQWVVCETLGRMAIQAPFSPVCMIDDSEGLGRLVLLSGTLALDMLHVLETENQLDPATSEIKDLGIVMAMYVIMAQQQRANKILDSGRKKKGSSRKSFFFDENHFDEYIVSYAQKYNITLWLPQQTYQKAITECAMANPALLPPVSKDGDKKTPVSPWAFKKCLREYEEDYAGLWARSPDQRTTIGGDSLDITSWTPAERKAKSFSGKDPLSKKVIEDLKAGMVMEAR